MPLIKPDHPPFVDKVFQLWFCERVTSGHALQIKLAASCPPHHPPTLLPPTPLRDGRVSENTVCLIRKLLVLDPQQRLSAGDVLESLSVIIASW